MVFNGSRLKTLLMGSAVAFAAAMLPTAAHASGIYPYAYASNLITGLIFTGQNPNTPSLSNSETVSDSAQFGNYSISGHQASNTIDSGLSISQAYSGAGSAPGASFSAVGMGNFTGERSNAAIGSYVSGTGVSVSNIAEGSGNQLGNAQGGNVASITFDYKGSGSALTLSFKDAYSLAVNTTSGHGGTAQASVQDTFQISGGGNTAFYSPFGASSGGVNGIGSANGVGNNSFTKTNSYTYTTPFILVAGTTYAITLNSFARNSIIPNAVPEPGSLLLLGTGLLGLGLIVKRKTNKKV